VRTHWAVDDNARTHRAVSAASRAPSLSVRRYFHRFRNRFYLHRGEIVFRSYRFTRPPATSTNAATTSTTTTTAAPVQTTDRRPTIRANVFVRDGIFRFSSADAENLSAIYA